MLKYLANQCQAPQVFNTLALFPSPPSLITIILYNKPQRFMHNAAFRPILNQLVGKYKSSCSVVVSTYRCGWLRLRFDPGSIPGMGKFRNFFGGFFLAGRTWALGLDLGCFGLRRICFEDSLSVIIFFFKFNTIG